MGGGRGEGMGGGAESLAERKLLTKNGCLQDTRFSVKENEKLSFLISHLAIFCTILN